MRCARLAAPTTLRSALVALDLERGEEEGIEENSMQCVYAMILDSTDIHDAFRLSMRLKGAGETRQVQLGNEERGAKRKKQRQKRNVLRQNLTGRMREWGAAIFFPF